VYYWRIFESSIGRLYIIKTFLFERQ